MDGLEEQLAWIKVPASLAGMANYVDEVMRPYDTAAGRRQRELVSALRGSRPTPRSETSFLTPQLAAAYAGETSKTVTRDINRLLALGLIERTPHGLRSLIEKMESFTATGGRERGRSRLGCRLATACLGTANRYCCSRAKSPCKGVRGELTALIPGASKQPTPSNVLQRAPRTASTAATIRSASGM